jgi:hypothetical protein
MKTKAPSSEGRFANEGLDQVIHERVRLSVLTFSDHESQGSDLQ